MLSAADDLAIAMLKARTAVGNVLAIAMGESNAQLSGGSRGSVSATYREAEKLIDQAAARLARIDLLFGVGKPAAVTCTQQIAELVDAMGALRQDPPDVNRAQEKLHSSLTDYKRFTTLARSDAQVHGSWVAALLRALMFRVRVLKERPVGSASSNP
jgi:hypothetical protein